MATTTSATPETVFMLRISLKNIKPEVWRRVLVPGDYTFKDLHDVIMAVMGWSDYHMHKFSMKHPVTNQEIEIGGVGDLGYGDYLWLPESTKIAHYLFNPNQKAFHEYDFGSPWYHTILFEKTLPAVIGDKYPKCIGGKNLPPPEEDPGSDYSESEYLCQEFDHTRVSFARCRQSIVKSPQKDKESSSASVSSTSSKKKLPSEAKGATVKRQRVIRITSPTAAGVLRASETIASFPDVALSSASSEEQLEAEKKAEESFGKYIASQMLLVSDLEKREELRSIIQSTMEKYKLSQK